MDFTLSEEAENAGQYHQDHGPAGKIKELARHIDEMGEFPFDLLEKYAGLGLLGMTISVEQGGGSQPAINAILCIEELAKFSPMIAGPVFESTWGR